MPSRVRTVSATEAAKNLGSILTGVRERATEYIVEHRGKAVARITPEENRRLTLGEFAEIVRSGIIPSPGEEYLRAVEDGIAYFNRLVARTHAILTQQLGRQGPRIGAHDLIIAATAVSVGYRVATRDRRSFDRVEGLEVEYW